MSKNIHNEEDCAADVAVIGLGPGGLAAALRAAQQGKKVIAFTDRTQYIRGQRLKMSSETKDFLRSHVDKNDPEDVAFHEKYLILGTMSQNSSFENSIQTKDIERFLYRKLQKYKQNVSIVDMEKQNPITAVGNANSANYIELKDGSKYYCRNILAADGARHSFANVMNTSLGADITYTQSSVQERHKYHAVVQLQLKNGEMPSSAPLPYKSIIDKMKDFFSQGWSESFQPKHYIFTNAEKTKFYFAGEIPESIFAAPDSQRSELLKKWAGSAIFEEYNIRPEQMEYRQSRKTPAKDKLQCTVFEMNMTQCQKPIVDLTNGVFAQIGDARRTPNYNLGHGMNDAIRGGIAFVDAVQPVGFNRVRYQRTIQSMDRNIEANMNYTKSAGLSYKQQTRVKLLAAIDSMIERLEIRYPGDKEGKIQSLKTSRDNFKKQGHISDLYDNLNAMKPYLTQHRDQGLLYRAYRLIASFFGCNVNETKSTVLLKDVEKNIENYTSRPSF